MFNCRGTDHGHGNTSYDGLADVFGIYFAPIDAVYLVPVAGAPRCGKAIVRLQPSRNNQRLGIRLAADYEFVRWSNEALRELISSAPPLHSRLAA